MQLLGAPDIRASKGVLIPDAQLWQRPKIPAAETFYLTTVYADSLSMVNYAYADTGLAAMVGGLLLRRTQTSERLYRRAVEQSAAPQW